MLPSLRCAIEVAERTCATSVGAVLSVNAPMASWYRARAAGGVVIELYVDAFRRRLLDARRGSRPSTVASTRVLSQVPSLREEPDQGLVQHALRDGRALGERLAEGRLTGHDV